ncbi:hypothetical protein DIPPA_34116 [Diplonema papillatum]|nr:hypothetical protein DIPPA_34116 [Diplonema papillatum]
MTRAPSTPRMLRLAFESGVKLARAEESSVLALRSENRTSGIVLEIGHSKSVVTVIYEGERLAYASKANACGSDRVVEAMQVGFSEVHGLQLSGRETEGIVTDHGVCAPSAARAKEVMRMAERGEIDPVSWVRRGGRGAGPQAFDISRLLVRSTEALFSGADGLVALLHDAVAQVFAADFAKYPKVAAGVVLAGALADLPGLRERLAHELHPWPKISFLPPHPRHAAAARAWHGAAALARSAGFLETCRPSPILPQTDAASPAPDPRPHPPNPSVTHPPATPRVALKAMPPNQAIPTPTTTTTTKPVAEVAGGSDLHALRLRQKKLEEELDAVRGHAQHPSFETKPAAAAPPAGGRDRWFADGKNPVDPSDPRPSRREAERLTAQQSQLIQAVQAAKEGREEMLREIVDRLRKDAERLRREQVDREKVLADAMAARLKPCGELQVDAALARLTEHAEESRRRQAESEQKLLSVLTQVLGKPRRNLPAPESEPYTSQPLPDCSSIILTAEKVAFPLSTSSCPCPESSSQTFTRITAPRHPQSPPSFQPSTPGSRVARRAGDHHNHSAKKPPSRRSSGESHRSQGPACPSSNPVTKTCTPQKRASATHQQPTPTTNAAARPVPPSRRSSGEGVLSHSSRGGVARPTTPGRAGTPQKRTSSAHNAAAMRMTTGMMQPVGRRPPAPADEGATPRTQTRDIPSAAPRSSPTPASARTPQKQTSTHTHSNPSTTPRNYTSVPYCKADTTTPAPASRLPRQYPLDQPSLVVGDPPAPCRQESPVGTKATPPHIACAQHHHQGFTPGDARPRYGATVAPSGLPAPEGCDAGKKSAPEGWDTGKKPEKKWQIVQQLEVDPRNLFAAPAHPHPAPQTREQQLAPDVSVDIREPGQAEQSGTVIGPYSGDNGNLVGKNLWWVRAGDGQKRLKPQEYLFPRGDEGAGSLCIAPPSTCSPGSARALRPHEVIGHVEPPRGLF